MLASSARNARSQGLGANSAAIQDFVKSARRALKQEFRHDQLLWLNFLAFRQSNQQIAIRPSRPTFGKLVILFFADPSGALLVEGRLHDVDQQALQEI